MEKKIEYPSNKNKLYFFNFSPWRMMQIEPFFYFPGNQKYICKTLNDAIEKGIDSTSSIFIYGIVSFLELEEFAREKGINLYRIEDAFIRSVALGSGFAKPYSLSVDSRGIYFDPRTPSDLEHILATYNFNDELIERAKNIRDAIVSAKFSKYNHLSHQKLNIDAKGFDKIILVTGQVEDDMSIKYGAYGLNNSDLLQMVRERNPKSYIIYKPHPDVLSGNRVGDVSSEITERCANMVQTNISIDSCIVASDEVHTLTSGAGFDALLRRKKVFTYGMPFYAGWGLTTDYLDCDRRTRILGLDELVAATLILFPRYISPKTKSFCEVEQTLKELKQEQEKYFGSMIYRFSVNTKSYLLPRARRIIRAILKPFGLVV